jgi:acetyl-CoA carboxylase biotin carboxylase subunit
MRRALKEFVVKGIKTSIPFHRIVMEHPSFVEGHFDTGFIENEILSSSAGTLPPDEEERRVGVMLAAIAAYKRDRDRAGRSQPLRSRSAPGQSWRYFGRRGQMRGPQ